MMPTSLKTFVHRHGVYRLEYPAHWDAIEEKDGESCGFGPHDRDDVGLWISIMPMSVDTERLAEELPRMMREALAKSDATNQRVDPTLRHHGMVADMTEEGQGGHYWIVVGGDVVLFASSQVPAAERDEWNPPFQRLMASLQITRDEHLLSIQLATDVLGQLRERHPEQDFRFEKERIRGRDQVIYLGNLFREVKASPKRRDELVKNFVENVSHPASAEFGHETWEDAQTRTVPVLKPHNYIGAEGPTRHIYVAEWLADVIICYAIRRGKLLRFVTGWDLGRWGIDGETLHRHALANLAALPWPSRLPGSRSRGEGHVIIVDTDDGLGSSRLLHPELHKLFSTALGNTFWAGIPNRNTLVLYSDRRSLKQRIARSLRKDHHGSAYPITPRPFLVTRDGIAAAPEKGNP